MVSALKRPPAVLFFKHSQSSSPPQYAEPQPEPTSIQSICNRPLTAHRAWPGVCEGISWYEPGWVVQRSPEPSEKLATTQDKHKQGHPSGRPTPRACVGACQPGLQPGAWGGGRGRRRPVSAPESTGSPQWKVCISPRGARRGREEVAIHQTPPLMQPSLTRRPQAKCILHAQ